MSNATERLVLSSLRGRGRATTHEIAAYAQERLGVHLSERQVAHYLGQLGSAGIARRVEEPCAVCRGRGYRPKWEAAP
jgi:hypothetical protein